MRSFTVNIGPLTWLPNHGTASKNPADFARGQGVTEVSREIAASCGGVGVGGRGGGVMRPLGVPSGSRSDECGRGGDRGDAEDSGSPMGADTRSHESRPRLRRDIYCTVLLWHSVL